MQGAVKLRVNGHTHSVPDMWADDTLVMVLREALGLVGTKVGCGTGGCGCCVVHADGQPLRSCLVRARQMQHADLVTLEGLAGDNGALHPVQQAWIDESVSQCGFCQGGAIMDVAAVWAAQPGAPVGVLLQVLQGHACRCGTHPRARRAIQRLRGTRPEPAP